MVVWLCGLSCKQELRTILESRVERVQWDRTVGTAFNWVFFAETVLPSPHLELKPAATDERQGASLTLAAETPPTAARTPSSQSVKEQNTPTLRVIAALEKLFENRDLGQEDAARWLAMLVDTMPLLSTMYKRALVRVQVLVEDVLRHHASLQSPEHQRTVCRYSALFCSAYVEGETSKPMSCYGKA